MNLFQNKTRIITLSGILTFTIVLGLSFNKPLLKSEDLLKHHAREFEKSVIHLNQLAGDYKFGLGTLDELRIAFLLTRKHYKRIEFFVEYYYPAFIEDHINGAPLLHIERHDTRPFVVPPEGLQVLDELIFADSLSIDGVEIVNTSQRLVNQTTLLILGIEQQTFDDGEMIDAMRQQMIRIFTLGITGFDTPGSLNALEDARVSFTFLGEVMRAFEADIPKERYKRIDALLAEAQNFLDQPTSFDDFDRLTFLKTCINPLYEEFYWLKRDLGLKSDKRVSALNDGGINMFSDNFLNPYFFTQLKEGEDSKELRALGEKLFYDPLLSHDGKMSCASCHNPALAFSDGSVKSVSNVSGQQVQRNSPTLINAVYADRYFYDLRAFTLEQQAEHVIFNTQEFNTAYEEIVEKLNNHKEYRKLFKQVLGTSTVSRAGFSKALASFILSLRSFNSPFDRYVRGEIDTLSPKVVAGFNLFMGKAACGTCHFAPTFSGLVPPRYMKNETEILGVLKDPHDWKKELDEDMGRYANEIYSEQAWIFERSFKTTTIRNVELTAPYFHNGAYPTLEAVVNFYNSGGGSGFGLQVKNQTLPQEPLELSPDEKEALLAFMKSLTDTSFYER